MLKRRCIPVIVEVLQGGNMEFIGMNKLGAKVNNAILSAYAANNRAVT